MSQSRLARAMARADLRRQQPPVLDFAAGPSPPRPAMDATHIAPYLLSQGVMPSWGVSAIGPEGGDPAAVALAVSLGPIGFPVLMTAAQARETAEKLVAAAEAVERGAAGPAPDAGPDVVVTSPAPAPEAD